MHRETINIDVFAPTASAYRPIPGPVDRDSFFAAQLRHRRTAAWLSVLTAVAAVLVGLPLATILFPVLFAIAELLSLILGRVFHFPDLVALLMDGNRLFDFESASASGWLGLALLVCLPGAIAMFQLWRMVWSMLAKSDLAHLFANLDVRAPRADDSEERQLVNVVAEMAISAAMPAPRVLLLDVGSINIACVGATPKTATMLVTRGLLEQCDRDETQALIADAMAMIGNGDLHAMLRWIAFSVTLLIVRLLLQAPYWPAARARLALLRNWYRQRAAAGPASDATAFAALLGDPSDAPRDLSGGRIRRFLTLPFFMAHALFNAVAWLASLLFLSPALTLLMRRRRYLADAIAVQLTRYPDALVSALARVTVQRLVPRTISTALTMLCVVAPPNELADRDRPPGFFFGTHPGPGRRHQRVSKMALLVTSQGPTSLASLGALPLRTRLIVAVLLAVLVPLVAVAILLMLYLIAVLTCFSLVIGMLYVMLAVAPIRWLFGE